MQNKTFLKTFFVFSFLALPAFAQVDELPEEYKTPTIDLSDKKTLDFSARTSMDTLELTPLPGNNETDITGPQEYTESVSSNDYPSEQLRGRLNLDVFEEMAQIERDTAFLKLHIEKAKVKNELENLRATYRQNRLDEIAKREDVVRTRIQWWQEQEKLRLEAEKQRQEAEELKTQRAEAEALKQQLAEAQKAVEEAQAQAQAEALKAQEQLQNQKQEPVFEQGNDAQLEPVISHPTYVLVGVKGTRGNLEAKVKNITSEQITTVRSGDDLFGETVVSVTPDSVILLREGSEYEIKF